MRLTLIISICCGFILNSLYGQEVKKEPVIIININNIQEQVTLLIPADVSLLSDEITVLKGGTGFGKDAIKKTYYPKDLKGYVLEDGRIFESEILPSEYEYKKVFLEKIMTNDGVSIYSYLYKDYKKPILFMKEKKMVQLDADAEPFKSYIIDKASSCENLSPKDFRNIQPKESDILNSYKALTNCNGRFLNRKAHFGIMAGLNVTQLSSSDIYTNNKNETSVGPAIGVFADIPFSYKSFSFRPELFYRKDASDAFLYSREHALILPLKVRYTHLNAKGNILPYIEAGVAMGYDISKITSYTEYPQALLDYYEKHNIEPPVFNPDDVSKVFLGLTLGGGIETSFIKEHPVYFGLNYLYTNANNIKSHSFTLNASIALF